MSMYYKCYVCGKKIKKERKRYYPNSSKYGYYCSEKCMKEANIVFNKVIETIDNGSEQPNDVTEEDFNRYDEIEQGV